MSSHEPKLKAVEPVEIDNADTFRNQEPRFEDAQPMLDPPLEITRDMLRLLNVVDETIIVHDPQ